VASRADVKMEAISFSEARELLQNYMEEGGGGLNIEKLRNSFPPPNVIRARKARGRVL
jgi:hypothetical protein